MNWGIPCRQKTLSLNKAAVSSAVAVSDVGRKWTLFDSLSTTTKMAVKPDLVFGKWTMKSMEICCHWKSGTDRGCSTP